MPKKKWIDKKTATTFALVHRQQNDPRIHDEDAASMVFKEVEAPNLKGKASDVRSNYDFEEEDLRENEGEAALHGVFFDDTEYDYMQHMRDLGTNEGYFIDAEDTKVKGKTNLADALRSVSLSEDASSSSVLGKRGRDGESKALLLEEDILPSRNLRPTTYQDQQDVPDALRGFQPNMDPRLREALEALEDDAYVDAEEEGDLFEELAAGGEELTLDEFEGFDGDEEVDDADEGYETDDTAKGPEDRQSDWMNEYKAFKAAAKTPNTTSGTKGPGAPPSSSILTSSSMGPRRKKRKGALTSTTNYSMTSSSLFRNEGLTNLDARFEKIEEEYANSDDEGDGDGRFDDASSIAPSLVSNASRISKISRVNETEDLTPGNFDGIMDDFLGAYSMQGKKRVKKGNQDAMEQLDEVRRGLGPARIVTRKAK